MLNPPPSCLYEVTGQASSKVYGWISSEGQRASKICEIIEPTNMCSQETADSSDSLRVFHGPSILYRTLAIRQSLSPSYLARNIRSSFLGRKTTTPYHARRCFSLFPIAPVAIDIEVSVSLQKFVFFASLPKKTHRRSEFNSQLPQIRMFEIDIDSGNQLRASTVTGHTKVVCGARDAVAARFRVDFKHRAYVNKTFPRSNFSQCIVLGSFPISHLIRLIWREEVALTYAR